VTESGFRTFSLSDETHTIKVTDVGYSKEVLDFRVLGNSSCFVVFKDKDGVEDIELVNLFVGAVSWHGYELNESRLIILEKKEIKTDFATFDHPNCTAKLCRTQSFDPEFSVFKWPVKGSNDFECLQMFGSRASSGKCCFNQTEISSWKCKTEHQNGFFIQRGGKTYRATWHANGYDLIVDDVGNCPLMTNFGALEFPRYQEIKAFEELKPKIEFYGSSRS
jgi:hypothetical protein